MNRLIRKERSKPRRRIAFVVILAGMFVMVLVPWVRRNAGPDVPPVVSSTTTRVTSPLTADGSPDYGQFVHRKRMSAVGQRANGVGDFWYALGASIDDAELIRRHDDWFGVAPLDVPVDRLLGEGGSVLESIGLAGEGTTTDRLLDLRQSMMDAP